MKHRVSKRILSTLLVLLMMVGMLPISILPVSAAHRCPDCEDMIDGSPYCEECYKCDACVDLCIECGKCTDCSGSEICDGCSTEEIGDNMCLECAIEKGTHCTGCDQCYFDVGEWCEECGMCADCVEIDVGCSAFYGQRICFDCAIDKGESHCPGCDACYGEITHFCVECGMCEDCVEYDERCSYIQGTDLCYECAAGYDGHCPGCDQCYGDVEDWCQECGLCEDCAEYDRGCSEEVGAIICKECAIDHGHHCPNCDQCYFDVGEWCSECGQCVDCCPACNYCCEEWGDIICMECAIDNGMHCPDCSECYGECGGEFCAECGICGNCAEINPNEDLCLDCAIAAGLHCPGCESYIEDAPLCEGCGERCLECAEAFCESCNLCSECVLMCQDCGSCEECATICPNCEEYCSECVGLCDDCGMCLVCCEDIANFSGCDCGEWVCVENTDWDEHFAEEHNDVQSGQSSHTKRPMPTWDWDSTYHWHGCAYCREDAHLTGKSKHTFDTNGICTVCRYVKDAKIQILVQPSDSKATLVTSPEEDYDEKNIARFSVKAAGKSELTYTWYEGYYNYGLGKMVYTPLTDPRYGEDYEGSEIYWLVPTDACNRDWYIRCVITDIYGNEVTTRDALVQAKHNYQYFKDYLTGRSNPYGDARKKYHGHILVCVSPECGKVTRLRQHADENLDYICEICDSQKDMIYPPEIFVTAPKEGNLPSYTVTVDRPACYTAMGGSSNYTQYRFWFVSDNGVDNWKLIDKTTAFVAGKYYKFAVEMQTKTGYAFPTMVSYDDCEPYIWAKVNGNYTKAHKTYGMDPNHYITIYYEFGVCNDSVVEDIIIESVAEPIAGEKPTYTAAVRGSGYKINSDKNTFYDAYWVGEKWYYIKNGIGWFDLTESDWVYENECFIPGHEYLVYAYLITEDGYEFAYTSKYYENAANGSVNGYVAEVNIWEGYWSSQRRVSCSFTCQGKKISMVMVNGLETPKAGRTPDYTATVAYPEWYQLDPLYAGTNGIVWYDEEGHQMDPSDTFIEGKKYKVEIKLIPAKLNGANTSQFVSPVSAYINGKQVVENSDWDAVYSNSSAVYVQYTFQKAASSPVSAYNLKFNANGGSGAMTSLTGQTSYTLPSCSFIAPYGKQFKCWAIDSAGGTQKQPGDKITLTNDTYIYAIWESIPQGANKPGDTNGDGEINIKDAVLLAQHLAKWSVNIDTTAADCNKDGSINTKDAVLLAQYLAKWNVTLG